ncbi:hypothetical protein [Acinetobacter bereziniae]|uniref:hypothetical protein n=1 Tax=Acinetobacter bereziniae TaxID=106648 RepID=UPI003009606A
MNLISGKEALIALANGEEVEYSVEEGVWVDFGEAQVFRPKTILTGFNTLGIKIDFRLKPRTITLNGIEVPAPFEPKVGDIYFIIHPAFKHGYTSNTFTDAERHKDFVKYGAWRTLEEIKQVVAALRKVFKEPQQ